MGFAVAVALGLLRVCSRLRLDVSAEILPSHDCLDRLQRIALGADRLQPALNIEKALLPHDSPAPFDHYHERSPSQIRPDLARGIFRGAFKSIRRKRRISRCRLQIAMTEIMRQRPSIFALVGELVSGAVPKHVRVNLERKFRSDACSLD